ncbi:MAG: hypothetical protein KIPDCIKN_04364 [Haliscomenobacter sp.]|nr:hypothetical protein [Haliscomenobacter sp.]
MDLSELTGEIVVGNSDVVAASASQSGLRGQAGATSTRSTVVIEAPPGGHVTPNDIFVDATANGTDFTYAFLEAQS